MSTLLKIVKNHDCLKIPSEDNVRLVKFEHKFEHNPHWTLIIVKFDIELYFIDYCPYCGVKLL